MASNAGPSSKARHSGLGKPSGKVQIAAAMSPLAATPEAPGIPHIRTADNAKLLPKYYAALQRPANDTVPPEDLDQIQLELETLLSTVALRYRYLKAEYEVMDKNEEKREKKGKMLDRQPSSPGKRKRVDDKPSKKDYKQSGGQSKISKMKNNPIPSPATHTDDSMDAVLVKDNPKLTTHRYDLPNKFWLSVEPYCMPLTHEDIKLLDDLLEEYSGSSIPPIPELGPHYSSVWASEDLKEEHDLAKGKGKANSFNFMKRSEKIM